MSQITDQIKDRIDMVELVREYVPSLKKLGLNWKANCPFHQEKTASFVVSPEKQIWHCFGCGKGGDVFGFIRETEGLEFPDALRVLAKRAGVKLVKQDPKLESERSRILDMLRLSAAWYHKALLSAKSGDTARAYVKKREIKEKTLAEWQIGFAPDKWDELLKYLTSRGYREQEIAKAGLASANDRGGYYDRFRNRLLFPIKDAHGSVVGFTGRKLKEEDTGGKYINTAETSVFHKSRVLYGLSAAKQSIRQNDLAIVVEGNMDCLSSHQAGVTNTVAASGTALTGDQVRLLKRFTKNICLAFDPDEAGQEALTRGLQIAWQEDMAIKVASLPAGMDPDDVIKKDVNEWKNIINSAQDFMEWMFVKAEKDNDITTAQGKKSAAKTLLSWISRLPNAIEQTHYLQILGRKIGVDENILRGMIAREKPDISVRPDAGKSGLVGSGSRAKRSIIDQTAIRLAALLLKTNDIKLYLDNLSLDWIADEDVKSLYKSLKFFYDGQVKEGKETWLSSLEEGVAALGREVLILSDESALGHTDKELEEEVQSLISRLKVSHIKNQLHRIREQIQSAEASGDINELQKYLNAWQKLNKELRK